ncbi:hypothetical protein [Caudoviricetes sp.]|nr:hypothetical protein [Caudoviricetes sp.]
MKAEIKIRFDKDLPKDFWIMETETEMCILNKRTGKMVVSKKVRLEDFLKVKLPKK